MTKRLYMKMTKIGGKDTRVPIPREIKSLRCGFSFA